MRIVLSSLAFFALVVLVMPASANSITPETPQGKCCKANGGRWDPARKIWGFCDKQKFAQCLASGKYSGGYNAFGKGRR